MPNNKAFFITGTDTGVGKTHVSVSLVKALVQHGLKVGVMKPIASGSDRTPDGLRNEDATALQEASNVDVPYATLNPYCFEPAISPHIAAEEAEIDVDIDVIKHNFDIIEAKADVTIVEGAGGWYAPIGKTQSMADLPKALNIPAILVVGVRLGCLSHAQLSKEAIEARGVPFAGWVANSIDPKLERAAENLATLERILGCPPLAMFPFTRPEPGGEPMDEPTGQPTHGPAAEPAHSPTHDPVRGPMHESPHEPAHEPAHELTSQPTSGPTRGPRREPAETRPPAPAPAQTPAATVTPPVHPNVHCGEHFARRLSLIS